MMSVVRSAGFLLIPFLGLLMSAQSARVSSSPPICPLVGVTDFLFPSTNRMCLVGGSEALRTGGVIEGNEVTLQKALTIVHKHEYDYVALLFYSSSCPFSAQFRPMFSFLSSVFTSIPHFAIEESAVRPSTLSKFGVHGFPSFILLNSTMRVRYEGYRTIDSIFGFYDAITGRKASPDGVLMNKIESSMCDGNHESLPEACPFSWARCPENLIHQETYLTLATIFVVLRLLYYAFPTLQRCTQSAWRTYTAYLTTRNVWERPAVCLNQLVHFLNSLKKRNLQEGAKNAQAWASKSLASVSLGDTGSSSDAPVRRNG